MVQRLRNLLKRWIKGNIKDFYWRIYGINLRNPRFPKTSKAFLFICKGNICRGPFAEHLVKKLAREGITEAGTFYSAGLEVSGPLPSPKEAVLAAEKFGLQLNGHRSRGLTQEMVESFDMIIAMEAWHFKALRKAYPKHNHKFFLLPFFDTKNSREEKGFLRYNIQDPYGRSVDEFYACFQRINYCIEGLFKEIRD